MSDLKMVCVCGKEIEGAIKFYQHFHSCKRAMDNQESIDLCVDIYNMMNNYERFSACGDLSGICTLNGCVPIIQSLHSRVHKLEVKLTARDESLDKANTQIERMRERDRWIPVSEGLPENGQPVWAAYKIGLRWHFVQRRYGEGDWFDENGHSTMSFDCKIEPIAYWKPITPPTDKGD